MSPTPVITSLLGTDLPKFTMWQAMLHRFPAAQAECRFHSRRPTAYPLADLKEEVERELDHLCGLRFTADEPRHDSGDLFAWGEKALAHHEGLRIGAHVKRLVFSDGLDIDTPPQLYRHFADRTQPGLGIGTHLTNDMGLKPLHIVVKLTRVNGQPVAKLSDSAGRTMCDDETLLAYLRQVFGVSPAP
jgi:nicotinic acid phosphoribosyltransferase